MKYGRFALLVIPIFFAVLALSGWGYLYQSAVSGSCSILLLLVPDKKIRRMAWFIVATFLFSIAGDGFLSHRNGLPIRFIAGIGLFLMAHFGYILFCIKNGEIKQTFLLFLLIGYLLLFYFVFYPSIHDYVLLTAVLLYIIISCLSLAAAAGLKLVPVTRWFFTIGITCLVFSDTLIALREFAGFKGLYYLMLPTYYGSQIMVTLSLLLVPKGGHSSKVRMSSL